MRHVLHAYALHNPSIGYCQGMNFVVAILLQTVTEEMAFWMLVTIVDDLAPGLFAQSFHSLLVCIVLLFSTSVSLSLCVIRNRTAVVL